MSGGEKLPTREDVMKGFKDSTRTRSGFDFARTTTPVKPHTRAMPTKREAKVGKVMREFKAGDLHSGSKDGPKVTNPKQAVAIALSEADRAPMKKAKGGAVRHHDTPLIKSGC